MFKPNDGRRATRHAMLALVLLLPLLGQCGVLEAEPDASAPSLATPRAAEGYQVRCWQFGRLLFEENNVAFPADTGKYGVKMSGTDRQGRPVYVAETQNATCLIRSVDDNRRWPK
jgi:hypothetical protein